MTHTILPHKILRRAFPGIHESEAEEIVALGQVREYPQGAVLTREGANEYIFYILLDGTVEVTKEMNDLQSRLMKTLSAGDFFGEMALIHNAPRAATVKTMTPVVVLEIHKEAFTMLLERNTTVSLAMVREVSRRLRENDELAIGDLRVKARELADAYQQLAEMDYARHEFLTTIAHELRTPLTAAGGFLQMIRKGMLQGEALTAALDTVASNIQDIVTLTNDLLFLQEMDLILTDFQATDVGKIVASVLEQVRERAERSGVGLELKIVPNLPGVAADATSLERAISAIVDNAVKFSPDGGAVLVEVDFNNSWVWVRVEDHGVGIPNEAMPRIFDRYYRLDEVCGHLFRGVGLGLSIAQKVIEEHGGRISVDSKLGEGSVFSVYLPLSQVQPARG
jgi:signal transduction histidine kinase